ncbi:MAG: metal ABC transporter permease [Verrucomicrobia bacterium]|nr:metal ABC transporter permease [Verrucomicrobiota bacterium]
MTPELAIILTACLTATACAIVGTFLVLRKMALIGDAISHAVLPGIVIAFFFTHSLNSLPMLIGASLFGLVTVALIEALSRTRRVAEDSAIGVVFPALFALGVLLISQRAGQIHLDTDCVLYGDIAWVPFNTIVVGGVNLGPRSVWVLGAVTLANLLFVLVFWKELKISTFDPELAAALGLAPVLIQYLLMGAVSVTTVAAFESVGAILVVAMLIVPAATAYLFTDRLWLMLTLAIVFGVLAAVSGYFFARAFDFSIAGAMALAVGVWFTLAWLFAPRHGVVAQLVWRARLSVRFAGELLVAHMADRNEPSLPVRALAGHFRWREWFGRLVVRDLLRRQLVRLDKAEVLLLTETGRQLAREFGREASAANSHDR